MAMPKPEKLTARDALQLGVERLQRAGIESARLDMSLLLAEALGLSRLMLYTDLDRPLTPSERQTAREYLGRRLKREPIAYILGRREFYGLEFEVNKNVLIPRPETELLVERAIAWINEQAAAIPEPLCVDVGTGSGAIAVAVAQACPATRWIATDVSPAALAVARRNAEKHGVAERIEFREGSLLEPVRETADAVLSNPPYVAEADRLLLEDDVVAWEPQGALFSGADGLDLICALIQQTPKVLRPGGLLLMECGQGQSLAIQEALTAQAGYTSILAHKDLAEIERTIEAFRN